MMQENNEKNVVSKSGVTNELTKEIKTLVWSEKVTIIDLSTNNISNLEENVKFPANLVELNLSHNQLDIIPQAILSLQLLKKFDISFNKLQYFDEVPSFCHHIEDLNLSNNNLAGIPYWVWSESPQNLAKLDLSNNTNITKAFEDEYFEELLQYSILVTDVKLHNCRLKHHLKLLQTLPRVKILELGCYDFGRFASNYIEHIPCPGLDQSYDIERLNLCNTNLYNIDPNIDIYKNLIEIDLSNNNITSLPNEFCNLVNLETCVLSSNKILYLPEDMVKLKMLVCLRIDSNELCMVPENMSELSHLKVLDLYDNSLYEVSDDVWKVEEVDLAQNYLEEPGNEEYLEKKEKLRLNTVVRLDGRKTDVEQSESVYSSSTTDDEELINYMNSIKNESPIKENTPPSSPEDWDSDDYWVPGYFHSQPPPRHATWLYFVKKKMEDGHFCPMDIHPVSISETVKYEKLCNPKVWVEVEGQFDDYDSES